MYLMVYIFYDSYINSLINYGYYRLKKLYIQDYVPNKINEEARMLKARIKKKFPNSLTIVETCMIITIIYVNVI